jgi:pimeloyl-ACP methyl ester carboxylesterase
MMTTLDGFPVPVGVSGPEKGVVVVILGDEQRELAAYDAVCERLHTASLRTIVWAVVVGDRAGGDIAWELAATKLGRFVGLVVVDRGHPRVADVNGVVRDDHCPPVEIGTTVLASTPGGRAVANNSQRYVYADYRTVDLLGRRNAQESTAQLAAEIVLRTSTW